MVGISFESNIAEWSRDFPDHMKRQIPFATSLALNATAKDIKSHSVKWMQDAFDRPTRWTLNSMRVERSTKGRLIATTLFKSGSSPSGKGVAAGTYLRHHIEGTPRVHTRFERLLIHKGVMESNEYAMPGRALKLNRFGNVSVGIYAQIIAQLRIGFDGIGNESQATRAKRMKSKRAAAIFIPQITKGMAANRLPRGIWRRRGKNIEPLFVFVTNRPDYDDAFDFYNKAEHVAIYRFPIHLSRSFERAMKTAR